MKILVTGGAGFVGKNLTRLLLSKGYEVIVFDNFENSKMDDVPAGATVVTGDVRNEVDLKNASGCDVVVHLAAKISVPESIKNPYKAFETNFLGTVNVAKANPNASFVFASSAAVYGDQRTLPISEGLNTNPISPYGMSKLFSEVYLDYLRSTYGRKISILRFFNIYGSGQTANQYAGVIVNFLKFAKEGRAIEIFGDGEQTRDFVNVSDVCSAIEKSFRKNGVWNIGSGNVTTINELANVIRKLSKKSLEIKHTHERAGEIKDSLADISKAKKDLGWKPLVSLEDGLTELMS